jgi:pimeloyl-ACP methyl ester carboxylesterase
MTAARSDRPGDGPAAPFILIHGFADTAATWAPLVPLLEPAAPVRCWELPGHGARGGDPPGLMSRDAAVADLAGQVTALGAPARIAGHSLGGYLALALAITRPALVASLTLICSGPGFRDSAARAEWNRYMDAIAARNQMARAAALAHQPDSFVIDNLAAIRCPLLHILGSEDTRYLAGARYLRKALPTSRLVTIPGAGHHPQVTHPAPVAAAILAGAPPGHPAMPPQPRTSPLP